jgi:AcrR family transcriptional regulator
MASSNVRPYGGLYPEERRAQRREKLLDAGLTILAIAGPEGLTVRGVCRRAGLNDRYFSENFRTCDELLGAVADRALETHAYGIISACLAEYDDPKAQTAAIIEGVLQAIDDDPRLLALVRHLLDTPALRSRREAGIRTVATIFNQRFFQSNVGATGMSAIDTKMSGWLYMAGFAELLRLWAGGELEVSRQHLAEFVTMSITSSPAMKGSVASGSDGNRNDLTDSGRSR